jgi:hypothetical protein
VGVYRHCDRAAIGASDLRKIPDPKDLVVRHVYFQRRIHDDSTLEWAGKNQARDAHEKESNQPTAHGIFHGSSVTRSTGGGEVKMDNKYGLREVPDLFI